MVNRIVEVPIDLDDIDEDDLVEYLEDRGYLVEKERISREGNENLYAHMRQPSLYVD